MRKAFEDAHERQYGYRSPEERVEIVTLRLLARGRGPERNVPDSIRLPTPPRRGEARRQVYFGPETGWVETPVIGRFDLGTDGWMQGPLLIEEYDSTTVVPPNGRARRITWDTIELELR